MQQHFRGLHQHKEALVIYNIWDVCSAQLAESLGAQAIGTSSAAIAATLGYADGEQMSFDELYFIVQRVLASTTLPLTVDLESGYSRVPSEVALHCKKLAELCVAGVNLEDSSVGSERQLLDAEEYSRVIIAVKEMLKEEDLDLFINLRSDTFLLREEDAVEESKKRIAIYTAAGADGIFLPCIEKIQDILEVVAFSVLPINVMCTADLPDFSHLSRLGVKRISMGNYVFEKVLKDTQIRLNQIGEEQSFHSLF